MDEQEIYSVLENFRSAIEELQMRVSEMDTAYHGIQEQYDEKIHHLEETLFDKLLTPAQEALAEQEAEAELADFRSKYGDKLDVFTERLLPIEGEDFDLTKKTLDGWKAYEPKEGEEPFTEATYVEAMVEQVQDQLNAIKEAVNASPDAEAEVVTTPDGETTVAIDGKPVEEIVEEPKEEETADEEEALEESEELSEDEMKRLEEEMRAEGLI